jgi:hypothetical protein
MPVSAMFWPGTDGARPSARFQAFLEGLQEAEARIFLEQALDRKQLPEPLGDKARQVLFAHNRGTFYISSLRDDPLYSEHTYGWQDRSAALFEVAAEAAKIVSLDVDRRAVALDIPARGEPKVTLHLRNWTAAPRQLPQRWHQSAVSPAVCSCVRWSWPAASTHRSRPAGSRSPCPSSDAQAD